MALNIVYLLEVMALRIESKIYVNKLCFGASTYLKFKHVFEQTFFCKIHDDNQSYRVLLPATDNHWNSIHTYGKKASKQRT